MKKCKVLDEANGVSDTIENFNLEDKNQYQKIKNTLSRKNIKHLVTIARGSSDSAALFASYLFAKSLGVTTYSLPPSIITHEKSKFDFSKTLVLIISQSGLSDDLKKCSEECRKMGALIIVLTNNSLSPIINNADFFLNINAKKEESVAATKTYLLSLVNIVKLVAVISNEEILLKHIINLPNYIEKEFNQEWDPGLVNNSISKGFVISRGLGHALSTEISLKFKEFCLELLEPFSSAEVMHGPKSLIDNSLKIISLSLNDASGISVLKEIETFKNITDYVYSINSNHSDSMDLNYNSIGFPEIDSLIVMAKFYPWIIKYTILKGLDPDKPRYLKKYTNTF